MSTYPSFTVDDLDAELKKQDLTLANMADYTTRRARVYDRALSEYNQKLIDADDVFVHADTVDSPIVLGAAKIAATGGYIYEITPPADFQSVAGSDILIEKSATGIVQVARTTWDAVQLGTTTDGFWEKNGKILIYCKDTTTFDSTYSASFTYYRKLDATQTPTNTALDIKQQDFSDIVSTTLQYMKD